MPYNDRTYCSSDNCKNKCGRKLSDEELNDLAQKENAMDYVILSMSKFCDENGELMEDVT